MFKCSDVKRYALRLLHLSNRQIDATTNCAHRSLELSSFPDENPRWVTLHFFLSHFTVASAAQINASSVVLATSR